VIDKESAMQTKTGFWKTGCLYPVTPLKVSGSEELYLNRAALCRMCPLLEVLLSKGLMITASPDWRAVCIYSENRWEELRPQIEALPNGNPEARRIQRILLGNAAPVDEDEALMVPGTLVSHGKLSHFSDSPLWLTVFNGDSAELWSEHQLLDLCTSSQLVKSPFIGFLRGEFTDHRGRWIEDILALDDFWLEHTHDYIQWLFPIDTPSRANPQAPVLTEMDREWFRRDVFLRVQHRQVLDRMLSFFGLARTGHDIEPLDNLNPNQHIWLKRGGHNHLRITRIIRSLYLCHQQELARAVQQAFIEIGKEYGYVQPQTLAFWRAATD